MKGSTETRRVSGRDRLGALRGALLRLGLISIVLALLLTPFREFVGFSTAFGVLAFANLAVAMCVNLIRGFRPLASVSILVVGCLAAVAVALPADVRPWWLLYPIAAIFAVLYWKGRSALTA
jgi:hypothetical protein